MATTGVHSQISSHEVARASHRWGSPERYNIAADVCDKHPRDKLAMVWEDCRGNEREVSWGELQSLSAQAANVLGAHGVERGDRIAVSSDFGAARKARSRAIAALIEPSRARSLRSSRTSSWLRMPLSAIAHLLPNFPPADGRARLARATAWPLRHG